MYAKPVSDCSPAASWARSASHPFVPATGGASVNIHGFGSSVSRRSCTKPGHDGTRPSAFSAAVRR